MKKNTAFIGEKMMRSRLQAKLGNPDGKRYGKHKTLYFAIAAYSFLLFAIHEIMFSIMLLPQGYYKGTLEQRNFFHANFFVVQAALLLFLAGFVLMLAKKDFAALWCQVTSGGLVIVNLVQIAAGFYNNKSYMFVAYTILLVGVYASVMMLVMHYKQKQKLEKAVRKEYEKIYKRYATEEGTLFGEEQLERILVAYETALANGQSAPESIEF